MPDSLLGRAILELRTNPDGLRAGMAAARSEVTRSLATTNAAAQAALARTSASMAQAGQQLTLGITLPVLAAGRAIVTAGVDMDRTLNQIVGLAGVAREEIGGIKEEVLALGGETGRAPQELAEAFYFVASAGFEADEAMEVLKISARAAAAGLGTTQAVAQVLGLTINSYGKENITAARAADVLVAAVREGTAEADAFASVLGRVVPTAASLGVTFDQVTAALAGMTITGLSAEESATSLNQIFVSLLKPTREAEQALEDMGLSSAELRRQLREEGLIATLRTLEEAFGNNEQAAGLVFGNVRALRGALSLLGVDAAQLDEIFRSTAEATGDLGKAYDETEGPARDLARAQAEVDAALIKLSEDVLPVVVELVSSLADGIEDLAEWFGSLPPDVRKLVVEALALLAALGPILLVVGSLGKGIAILWAGLTTLATIITTRVVPALFAANAAAGPLLLVVIALMDALPKLGAQFDALGKANEAIANKDFPAAIEALKQYRDNIIEWLPFGGALKQVITEQIEELERQMPAATAASLGIKDFADSSIDAVEKLRGATTLPVRTELEKAADAAAAYRRRQNEALDKALTDLKTHTGDALAVLRGYRTEIEEAYQAAIDAEYDAEITRNRIIVVEQELTAAKKEEAKARKKGDRDEIASTRIRRLEIEKELTALKLHAALIGDEMQQTTKLTALLTGQDMKDGLTSEMSETKAAYQALQAAVLERLRNIEKNGGPAAKKAAQALAAYLNPNNPLSPLDNAATWGTSIGSAYTNGIAAGINTYVIKQRIARMAAILEAGSPPKSPENPLHRIDEWGEATGRAWMDSFAGAFDGAAGALRDPLAAVAGVLGARFRGPSFAFAGGPLLPSSASDTARSATSKHYHLTVQGDLVAKDEESVLVALRRLEKIGEADDA